MAASVEARQPMPLGMSETYFASPIIPGHDWITAYDVVEAYNVLSARIRFHVHDILIVDNPLPSLAIFKAQSSSLTILVDLRLIILMALYSKWWRRTL
jgi:hypothetical protein